MWGIGKKGKFQVPDFRFLAKMGKAECRKLKGKN
jgi:hypothetical protein